MFGATPTQFVTGERYQIVGQAPAQGSIVTVGEAQLEFNSLWPGATKVVAAGLASANSSQAVVVFDWIGSSQPVPTISSGSTLTDLGPTSANPGPTVPIQAPAAASGTSTGTYVAVGLGVVALGALAWYAAKRSLRGRTYAYEGARDNPLPLLAAAPTASEWVVVDKRDGYVTSSHRSESAANKRLDQMIARSARVYRFDPSQAMKRSDFEVRFVTPGGSREAPGSGLRMKPGYAWKQVPPPPGEPATSVEWEETMVSRTVADHAFFLGYHQIGGDRMAVFRDGRNYYAQLPQNVRRIGAGERVHPTGHESFTSYKAAVRRYLETRNMATRKQAALIVDSLEDVIGRYWREGMPVASAAARLPAWG